MASDLKVLIFQQVILEGKKWHGFSFLIQVPSLRPHSTPPCYIFSISSSKKIHTPGLQHHSFVQHNKTYLLNACDVLDSLRGAGNNAAKRADTVPVPKVPALSPAEGYRKGEQRDGGSDTGWSGKPPGGGDLESCNLKDKKEMAPWKSEETDSRWTDQPARASLTNPGGEDSIRISA